MCPSNRRCELSITCDLPPLGMLRCVLEMSKLGSRIEILGRRGFTITGEPTAVSQASFEKKAC